jgi:hypothetical protein
VAAAKEAEAAVALEAASAGPSTTERTVAAMKAAVAATPPPPLPMSPPGTGFGSPTGVFGSGGGLPFASPPPPTPSVTYRGARADDLYASIDATASDIRSRGDLFAAALAGVGSGMGPGSGRYAGGTTASSLRLASPPALSIMGLSSGRGAAAGAALTPSRAPPSVPVGAIPAVAAPGSAGFVSSPASAFQRNRFAAGVGTQIPYASMGRELSAEIVANDRATR